MIPLLRWLARLLSPALVRQMGPALDGAIEETWRCETQGRGKARQAQIAMLLIADLLKQIVVTRRSTAFGRGLQPDSPLGGYEPMHTFLSDLTFGIRNLARTPVPSLVMLTTLALGIGGSTTVFTLFNAELVSPLPYREAERLLSVTFELDGSPRNFSGLNLDSLAEQAGSFESITGFDDRKLFNVTGGDEPVRLYGAAADATFFTTLGVEPILGRTFLASDDQPGAQRVVVLGEGIWRSLFAGDEDIVGRSVQLNGLAYAVIGIAPGTLKIPNREQLWVALATHPYGDNRSQERDNTYLEVVARLAPGVRLGEARAEMEAVSRRLAAAYPDANADSRVRLAPLRESLVGSNRALLATLMGAVVAVLLIACVNIAALQVSRAAARHKELAVRLALGATRARIARQLLTEALALSALAGIAGIGAAVWSRRIILTALPGQFPRLEHVGMDATVLLFVAAATLGSAILFGVLPALLVSAASPLSSRIGGSADQRTRSRVRKGLVVAQVAFALALLVNAGLLARSVAHLAGVDNGFDGSGVLTASLSVPESRYDDDATIAFFAEVLGRLNSTGTFDAAAAINRLPVSGGTNIATFSIEGRDAEYEAASHVRMVSPEYFETMSIPVREGRGFTAGDFAARQPLAIVDAEFASRHWPDGGAVGARVQPGRGAPWFRVIGVAGATRHWGPRFDPEPTIYALYSVVPEATMMLALRAAGDPLAQVADLRRIVWSVDPEIPVEQIRTMDDAVAASVIDSRASATVFGLFSAFALLLASLGVYGMLGQSVARRTREIGIRLALGADRRSVHRLIMRECRQVSGVGVLVGLGVALATSRAIAAQLHGIEPFDPVTFVAIALLLFAAAVLAALIPARRATRIDPLRSLRAD